jgi:hypothetical protein
MTAIDAIWDGIKGWFAQNATQCVCTDIPRERTDLKGPSDALVPLRSYVRLWLTDMFLAKSRNWFIDQYPAVHTSIGLRFGPETVKISHVTDGSGQVGPGNFVEYALTDLIPFSGGIVEIQSGLLALKGTNYLQGSIGILKDFSSLVAAPLGQTLDIAEKVSSGMQTLFTGGAGAVSLAFHKQYVSAGGGGGGNELRPGYIALISATGRQIDPEKLSVKGSKLHYARDGKAAEPLEGFDYMLLRIEGRADRDNWRMPNIEEPLNQAIKATVEGDEEKAKQYLTAALAVIWQSPDLAVSDRRRVADAVKAELADIAGQPRGATSAVPRSLDDIVKSRVTSIEARIRGPLAFAEVISQ